MPVSYKWSNGSISQNISGLKAGNYSVLVTDKNGCKDSATVTLTDPAAYRVFNLITPNPTVPGQYRNTIYRGYGAQTVAVSVKVYGAVPPYTYNWGAYGNTASINVSPTITTTYNCTIKDSRGCSKQVSITVTVIDVRCGINNNQVLLCRKKPGTNMTETICVDPSSVPGYLDQGAILGPCEDLSRPAYNSNAVTEAAVVFPNPATNVLDVEWKMINTSNEVLINVVDAKGLVLISVKGAGNRKKIDISRLHNGFYMLQIVGANNSTLTSRFLVRK
jgi:hypothetical protein